MKTRSLLASILPFALALGLSGGGKEAPTASERIAILHRHGSFHKHSKFKGWMRERRRSTFNKNK